MTAISQNIKLSKVSQTVVTYAITLAFVVLCSKAKVYTTLSPVPITLHTFAIAVMGLLLPFRLAMTCYLIYCAEGLIGSPFLGVPINFGPSCGYFVGMMVSLYFLSQVAITRKIPLLIAIISSSLIIWGFGVFHLQFMFGVKKALLFGVYPFIPGDILKMCLSYSLIQYTWKKRQA